MKGEPPDAGSRAAANVAAPRARRRNGVIEGRVRVRDPFDLVRHLAASQTDPRKAVAELIQNSLDAGARRVVLTRIRENGVVRVRILDDGQGVIPELDRPEALRFLATNIGHSRKRRLSPEERLRLMTQGQYGIGLLGFWCLGESLEVRSAVAGQQPYVLRLVRDRPEFRIEPIDERIGDADTWTEIVVSGLERSVQTQLVGHRLADWLASELRGQLLARQVELKIEDRISRSAGHRSIEVVPPRFLGEKLDGLGPIVIPGRPPIRLEIHFADGLAETVPPLAIYSAGTLVAESFHELSNLGLDHEPWTDPRLTGLVDFPALRIAPGSRRGIVPDQTSLVFATALAALEPRLEDELDAIESRRHSELDKGLVRLLQRVFRELVHERPRFSLLPIRGRRDREADGAEGDASPPPEGALVEADAGAPGESDAQRSISEELPAGPLAAIQLSTGQLRIGWGAERTVSARAVDEAGRLVDGRVVFAWDLQGEAGHFEELASPSGEQAVARVLFRAAATNARGILSVLARCGRRIASAHLHIQVEEPRPASSASEGIPEPELVDFSSAPWRSRVADGRWQVNSGHPDFRGLSEKGAARLRYLTLLFAKELVLHSTADPRLAEPLEQMIEIVAFADLHAGKRTGRKRTPQTEGESDGA